MANPFLQAIDELRAQAAEALARAACPGDVEAWRVAYLGRKGRLLELTRGLGALTPEARPEAGRMANEAKRELEEELEEQLKKSKEQLLLETEQRRQALEAARTAEPPPP